MKAFTFLLLSFCCVCSFAQSPATDADQDQVLAKATCDCISKQDLTGKNKKQIEIAVGLCILEIINANKVDVNVNNTDAMRAFGERIGVRMATICPSFFQSLMDADDGSKNATEKISAIDGKVKSINEDTFLFLIVQDNAGQEHRLIWLSPFDGSDGFVADPKVLIGKNISVKYRSREFYAPKAKGYLSLKEIVELKIKN